MCAGDTIKLLEHPKAFHTVLLGKLILDTPVKAGKIILLCIITFTPLEEGVLGVGMVIIESDIWIISSQVLSSVCHLDDQQLNRVWMQFTD
jgi:hypothetical protein